MDNRRIDSSKRVIRIVLWVLLLLPGLSYGKNHARLIEKTPIIAGQQAYIALPRRPKRRLPRIIVYSHGSNTTVTRDFNGPFMKDMRSYGRYFTRYNYIFAASAQHGVNKGSPEAIQDMVHLIRWIKKRYKTKRKVHLIGFSMGGLPTFHFAFRYPDLVSKIAGLAPTTHPRDWHRKEYRSLRRLSIRIWHGTKDKNVPYRLSRYFARKARRYRVHIRLITIRGGKHYDVDNELKPKILAFFRR